MSKCAACESHLDEDDDDDRREHVTRQALVSLMNPAWVCKVNPAHYCDACWEEHVCQRCGQHQDSPQREGPMDLGVCEVCTRNIDKFCGCAVLCGCQSMDVLCRDCVGNRVRACDRCATATLLTELLPDGETWCLDMEERVCGKCETT